MPAGLVEQQHGVRTGRDRGRDFSKVKRHALGIAAGQHEPRRPFGMLRTGFPSVGQMAP